jgi:hypothetical protein
MFIRNIDEYSWSFSITISQEFFGSNSEFELTALAYRTPIGIEIFLLSGLLVLSIAFVTVGYQSMKASFVDPVRTLRYE